MKATILVAHLIHANENKIVVEQLKQAVQNSMGSMPFPVLISYLCMRVGCACLQKVDRSIRAKRTITLNNNTDKYAPVV